MMTVYFHVLARANSMFIRPVSEFQQQQ